MKLCVTAGFSKKKIAPKIGKITKNGPKAEFFDFIEEFGH